MTPPQPFLSPPLGPLLCARTHTHTHTPNTHTVTKTRAGSELGSTTPSSCQGICCPSVLWPSALWQRIRPPTWRWTFGRAQTAGTPGGTKGLPGLPDMATLPLRPGGGPELSQPVRVAAELGPVMPATPSARPHACRVLLKSGEGEEMLGSGPTPDLAWHTAIGALAEKRGGAAKEGLAKLSGWGTHRFGLGSLRVLQAIEVGRLLVGRGVAAGLVCKVCTGSLREPGTNPRARRPWDHPRRSGPRIPHSWHHAHCCRHGTPCAAAGAAGRARAAGVFVREPRPGLGRSVCCHLGAAREAGPPPDKGATGGRACPESPA